MYVIFFEDDNAFANALPFSRFFIDQIESVIIITIVFHLPSGKGSASVTKKRRKPTVDNGEQGSRRGKRTTSLERFSREGVRVSAYKQEGGEVASDARASGEGGHAQEYGRVTRLDG